MPYLFYRHDNLHRVQTVETEVVGKVRRSGDLSLKVNVYLRRAGHAGDMSQKRGICRGGIFVRYLGP